MKKIILFFAFACLLQAEDAHAVYVKMTDAEFKTFMESKTKKFGLIDKVQADNIPQGSRLVRYFSKKHLSAETVEVFPVDGKN